MARVKRIQDLEYGCACENVIAIIDSLSDSFGHCSGSDFVALVVGTIVSTMLFRAVVERY